MKMKKSSQPTENILPSDHNFPSARYFQIHFQYLHELIGDLRSQIEKTNQQLAELQLQRRTAAEEIKPEGYGNTPEGFFEYR